MEIHADNGADITNETSSDCFHEMLDNNPETKKEIMENVNMHGDNGADITNETSSDYFHEMLDNNPETNKEIMENVNMPLQKKDESTPLQESGMIHLNQKCRSCNKLTRFLNNSSLSCDKFICSECQQQNRSTNLSDEAKDRSFKTINNQQTTGVCDRLKEEYIRHTMQELTNREKDVNTQVVGKQKLCELCTANGKSIPACFFCSECENEFLCEPCGKHHNIQKSTRTHKLQDVSHYMEAANTDAKNIPKLCEPCTANEKSIPACYFCADCENEFLCEPCGKHHNIQKSTRTHKLQDVSHYMEAANTDAKNIPKLCEPCTANEKSIPACYFCADCENEFLCEPCGKHHNIQKSTRTHKLQDVSHYMEAANTDAKNIQKLCEPCTANEKSIPACYFCADCENEFLCEPCGKHHNIQKSTRTHKLQDVSHYMEAANTDAKNIPKLCEPCTANEKSIPACYFCADCENEFLCEPCGKHHNTQKSTRTHKLQDVSHYMEAANTEAKNIPKLCEPCTANEKSIPACYFCADCENEFLCEPCGKHHNIQKSTRTHKLQDVSHYMEAANTDAKNIPKLCEPCTANEKSIPACYFCADCENEFLCEPCGKHHNIQKSTRTHKLQDVSHYMEAANTEAKNIQKLCEPCTANEKSIPACYFCADCENEFLCEPCGKHHNIQKSTRTHKLQDVSHYMEAANTEAKNIQKLCEPCTANEKSIPACYFCADCENEFLCEPCGKHHNIQKSTRTHKLQDVSHYMEAANTEAKNIQKLCEPCTANEKSIPACYFCADCENEFMCAPCGKHHTLQKSTRTHKLQDISHYMEAANTDAKNIQKLCEPCTANEKSSLACFFCAECENEFMCAPCGKHHTLQKSTRTHKLQDISQYTEDAKTDVKNIRKLCEPCTENKQSIHACFFCAECENEFLCDACGRHHRIQKSTRAHKLQDIFLFVEVSNANVTSNQKLCEPCKANAKSIHASSFCAECENEFLCEQCVKHHNIQKSTRTHSLQNIRQYVEVLNDEVTNNQKMGKLSELNANAEVNDEMMLGYYYYYYHYYHYYYGMYVFKCPHKYI
ncbi:hypothetical protein DPMN_178554 [Dreissena polymorpha]|uniref:Uncharacterized protein n=2 Tax=Opisthokonta TaxID=33154 RepID=A0A9D4EB53_DREPO|nr:hypothetical protein DPMN_178554 [Dreissena polymorpha]